MLLMPPGDIGKRIEEARRRVVPYAPNKTVLAQVLGVSPQRLGHWLDGTHDPPDSLIPAIAAALNTSEGWLKGESKEMIPTGLEMPHAMRMGKLPLLSTGQAGRGDSDPLEEHLAVPIQFMFPDYGCLLVKGDSMGDTLHNSDVAIFREWFTPRVGKIGAIRTSDNEILVKRYQYDSLGREWVLTSDNKQYDPIPMGPGFAYLGYLVGFYRYELGEETYRHNRAGLDI